MGLEEIEENPYKSPGLYESDSSREDVALVCDTLATHVSNFLGSLCPGYYSFISEKHIDNHPEMHFGDRMKERALGFCMDMVVTGELTAGCFGLYLGIGTQIL